MLQQLAAQVHNLLIQRRQHFKIPLIAPKCTQGNNSSMSICVCVCVQVKQLSSFITTTRNILLNITTQMSAVFFLNSNVLPPSNKNVASTYQTTLLVDYTGLLHTVIPLLQPLSPANQPTIREEGIDPM